MSQKYELKSLRNINNPMRIKTHRSFSETYTFYYSFYKFFMKKFINILQKTKKNLFFSVEIWKGWKWSFYWHYGARDGDIFTTFRRLKVLSPSVNKFTLYWLFLKTSFYPERSLLFLFSLYSNGQSWDPRGRKHLGPRTENGECFERCWRSQKSFFFSGMSLFSSF